MSEDFRATLAESRLASWGKLNQARLHAVKKEAGKTLLDVGCSTGDYVRALNQAGYLAFGIDLLEELNWTNADKKRFACADAIKLPFPDQSFDTILAFEVLEHIPDPAVALLEFHRVCEKNLVVSVPNCEPQSDISSAGLAYSHWTDRTHCNFFTRQSLSNLFAENGFRVREFKLINRVFLDYPVFRSFHVPRRPAYLLSRVLSRLPLRRQHFITILATAEKVPK